MKRIVYLVTLAISLLSAKSITAQHTGKVLVNVYYDVIHVNDTNHRDQPFKEAMTLQVARVISRYSRGIPKPISKPVTTAVAGPIQVVVGKPMAVVRAPGITDEELFQDATEEKMIITASLGRQHYLMDLKLPKIEWKISAQTKQVGGYKCQQATGEYAGRTYTAWFAPDLPFPNGPWKLSGLPGLILEATDARNEVSFLFKELSKNEDEEDIKADRAKTIRVSVADYTRARKAYYDDPVAGMQAQLSPDAPPVMLAYRDASGRSVTGDEAKAMIEKDRKEAKLRNNNPMELR